MHNHDICKKDKAYKNDVCSILIFAIKGKATQ